MHTNEQGEPLDAEGNVLSVGTRVIFSMRHSAVFRGTVERIGRTTISSAWSKKDELAVFVEPLHPERMGKKEYAVSHSERIIIDGERVVERYDADRDPQSGNFDHFINS